MVLISVNAVLGLLKRSTCARDRTHLVVCRYLPVWRIDAEPQSSHNRAPRLWLVPIMLADRAQKFRCRALTSACVRNLVRIGWDTECRLPLSPVIILLRVVLHNRQLYWYITAGCRAVKRQWQSYKEITLIICIIVVFNRINITNIAKINWMTVNWVTTCYWGICCS